MKQSMFMIFVCILLLGSRSTYAEDLKDPIVDISQPGQLTFTEENDYFGSNDDRHYTQGGRFSYLGPSHASNQERDCSFLGISWMYSSDNVCNRKYDFTLIGQSLFTPMNTDASRPLYRDRPYGAWLYTGASLLQEIKRNSYDTLDNYELLGGVVGPPALGSVTQNDYHQFIGVTPARGWDNQIHTEFGGVLTEERKWRFNMPITGSLAADFIPELGASLGNIFTYGEVGGLVRIGQNLNADYGPNHIRPSLSGTGWFDRNQLNGNLGWYLFLGTQERAVGHNIFLDGNTFRGSLSVDKKPIVADFIGGMALFWSDSIRADISLTDRTREFYGQRGSNDRFGSINIIFNL